MVFAKAFSNTFTGSHGDSLIVVGNSDPPNFDIYSWPSSARKSHACSFHTIRMKPSNPRRGIDRLKSVNRGLASRAA